MVKKTHAATRTIAIESAARGGTAGSTKQSNGKSDGYDLRETAPLRMIACRSPPSGSEDQGAAEISAGLTTNMLHPPTPVRAEMIETQAVFRRIDNVNQPCAKYGPKRRVEIAFKDGILHPLTIVETGSGNGSLAHCG